MKPSNRFRSLSYTRNISQTAPRFPPEGLRIPSSLAGCEALPDHISNCGESGEFSNLQSFSASSSSEPWSATSYNNYLDLSDLSDTEVNNGGRLRQIPQPDLPPHGTKEASTSTPSDFVIKLYK